MKEVKRRKIGRGEANQPDSVSSIASLYERGSTYAAAKISRPERNLFIYGIKKTLYYFSQKKIYKHVIQLLFVSESYVLTSRFPLKLLGSGGERQISDTDVQSAVWEVCGDYGAFQLLVDLLRVKLMDLEEGSGTEESDTGLLNKALISDSRDDNQQLKKNSSSNSNETEEHKLMSRNKWCSIVYRRGQKQLTRLFLKEAEHALQLSLDEDER